jgi:hypothetical protein
LNFNESNVRSVTKDGIEALLAEIGYPTKSQ